MGNMENAKHSFLNYNLSNSLFILSGDILVDGSLTDFFFYFQFYFVSSVQHGG